MTTLALPTLYPDNDYGIKAKLKQLNLTTAEVEALLTGTVTATLHVVRGGAIAHASLTNTLTHIDDDTWLVFFDASILTDALIDPLFTAAAAIELCVTLPNGFKAWTTIPYARYRPATVA